MISRLYLHQMRPVSATADCCGMERSSGGRLKSLIFAAVMPHFIVGAQKKIVFGPAGWFQNPLADCDMLVLNAADANRLRSAKNTAAHYPRIANDGKEWIAVVTTPRKQAKASNKQDSCCFSGTYVVRRYLRRYLTCAFVPCFVPSKVLYLRR